MDNGDFIRFLYDNMEVSTHIERTDVNYMGQRRSIPLPVKTIITGKMTITTSEMERHAPILNSLRGLMYSGERIDIGRFKDVSVTDITVTPNLSRLEYITEMMFNIGYISAPDRIEDMMGWECTQTTNQTSKRKVETMEHFDGDMFIL